MPTWACVAPASVLPAVEADAWLSADERHRWAQLRRPSDRDGFLAARVLVRALLTEALGTAAPRDWRITQSCPSCPRPHGRPRVDAPAGLSWGHAGDLVAAAVTTNPAVLHGDPRLDVGVDVEHAAGDLPPFPDGASTFDRVGAWLRWTRMEALVKRGDGDLDAALGWPLDGPAAPGGRPVHDLAPRHPRAAVLTDAVDPAGRWVASVAADDVATWLDARDVLRHSAG